eukprot:2813318-Lingulodinium_polyedra.AAC.1
MSGEACNRHAGGLMEEGRVGGPVVTFCGPIAKFSDFFREVSGSTQTNVCVLWTHGESGCSVSPVGICGRGRKGPVHLLEAGWRTARRCVVIHALE